MKIGKKITLAIALTLGSIIIGTNVSAIELNQRILSDNNLLLGASVDSSFSNGSSTTTTKEFNQTSWWDTWKNNKSVEITWDELKQNQELLCIESEAGLPSGKKIEYSRKEGPITFGTGESSYDEKEDYKIAYILSEQINSDQNGKELYEQDIQGALWRTEFNLDKKDLDDNKLAGEELYNQAVKYADYRSGYKEPQSIDAGELKTTNSGENKIVGPLKIKYTMTYVNTSNSTMFFGNITKAILKDDAGKEYTHGTDWWFVDANGNEISNNIGTTTYNYPQSEQTFYIKIKAGLNITKANLSFKFNNVNAKAEAMTLQGSYDYPASEGGSLHLCNNCKNKLEEVMAEVNCGVTFNGTFYEGYTYSNYTVSKNCGNSYRRYENVPDNWTGSLYGTVKADVYVCVLRVKNGGSIVQEQYSWVKCGQTYNLYTVDNGTGTNTTKTAYCGGTSCSQKACSAYVYKFSECAHDNTSNSCSACKKAYNDFIELVKNKQVEGCLGKTGSYTKIGKDGSLTIGNTSCGISSPYPEGTAKTQTLTIAKGSRTTTEDTLTLSFDVASVDLSLRKFITAVNDEKITNRVPNVDVSPLKSGQTTSNYNHTKETVGVKVGDKVTYTIRVYNEGAIDAYASEIKDYLPANLEFVSGIVDGVDYKWTKSSDGRTITTTYLKDTKLGKFDETSLKYADVKVICKVKDTASYNERLVNIAEISKYAYSSNNQKVEISKDVDSTRNNITKPSDSNWSKYNGNGSVGNYVKGQEDDDDFESVKVTKYVDISLRKFITAVNDEKITNRVPNVDVSPLKSGQTTSNYNHTKETVGVKVGDKVTYTIRVYNEGLAAGYATEIKDYLPANLEFVSGTVDGKDYKWTKSSDGRTITTTYLKDTKLEAFNGTSLKYADVKVICKVKDTASYNERLVNIAEVSNYALDVNGKAVNINKDIDSTENNITKPSDANWPNYNGNGSTGNYVKGQEDDDDFESVKVTKYVDISLRKFITAVSGVAVSPSRVPNVDVSPLKSGQTTSNYNHTKETVAVKVGDLVTYTIRVYNEGLAAGYATEIKDYLPANLEFVSGTVDGVDYKWTKSSDGRTITTTYLKDTKLEAFNGKDLKYADVKVICKVKNTASNYERLVNIAEISNYALDVNGKAVDINKDIDSTENNIKKPSDSDWSKYNGNGSTGNYVKGQEDDDDFESVTILNTDIGGTVWLDGVEGKQEERDGVLTNKDQRMSGITVRLYTSSDNYASPIATTTTDSNGNYSFTKAKINGVEQNIPIDGYYLITFEYGGQQYTTVSATRLTSEKYTAEKSAGEERTAERNALNAKFYEIVKGTAKNSSGAATVALNYTKDESKHTSSINRDTNFYNASKIIARTEGGFSGTAPYVKYINLGLVERAQVNLGLMTDVSKVDLTINGHTETYDYNGRDEGTAINLEAKTADLNRVYNQAIYKSDYNYRITDYNQTGATVRPDASSELQVYITYKIKVKNYSSKAVKTSQLVAYFAPEYNVVESWYEKGTAKGNVSWVSAGETNGYKKVTTNSIKDVNISANEDVYVYVKVQVAKDANGGVALGEKYIVVELGGYTTAEGLIDTNSEPGNIDISNWDNYVKTYEDDTDRAPGLNLYIKEGATRTMTGYVWEDSVSGTDGDGVKIGDGIKNGIEQNKNGITVQLIEKVTINGQVYEYIWQEVQTGNNKVSYMDRNGKLHENSKEVAVGTGEYKFTDYVPGTYIVRFKYGDTEASIDLNGQDYKSTTYKGFGSNTSSAKDNKDRRLAVMNYSIKQTNQIAEVLSGNNTAELINKTWMYADTVESMTIGINDENPGHNVNFGLIKRPTSKLVAIKEVNGIKISNKGIVYVDTANGITTGLRQAYGSYFIELDDELINGAELEVSYKIRIENQGEKDTLYNYFEGEAKYGSNQHELIKTQADLVYDFPEKLGYDENNSINPSWTKEGVDISILNGEVQSKVNNGALVVKATEKLNKALKPGESTDTIYMTLSKIMVAGGDDDLSYSNKVEIVSRINEVGRRDEESIPGNYVPQSDETLESDTGVADVTITDPTGQDRIYYGLWLGAGMLFIAGIVLIKKFALGKKK